jgi:glycosyltransferase involved in cell wall biosynthesis
MSPAVAFVAGRDPRDEISGGHSAYVRSYARAALAAGYTPHLFCAAPASRVEATDFGVVHRVASPARPFRQVAAGAHAPWLARAIVRFALGSGGAAGPAPGAGPASGAGAASGAGPGSGAGPRPGAVRPDLPAPPRVPPPPLVIHGFGVWGCAGARAAARLRRLGRESVLVVSSYTTYGEECSAKLRGAAAYGPLHRLRLRAAREWIRLVVDRWEHESYAQARWVLVNYDSVRRLVTARHGAGLRCRRLPYSCEAAFAGSGAAATGEPPAAPLAGRPAAGALPPAVGDGVPPAAIGALAEPRAPLVVAVSRHDPRKGIDVLLHALARLRAAGRPCRACLIGAGPLLVEHRRLAAALGLADTVVLTGAVPDPAPYVACADVYVLPSREEQSGSLALVEALRAGRAVVASGVDGILEDVADGHDAILVPPGDPAALAAALGQLLADPVLRQRLAAAALATFAARFSPAAVAGALRDLYTSLGAAPDGAPAPAA